MPHDPEKYLHDMLGSCRFLLDFTAGRTLEEYKSDRGFRSAVERELQIIGEALLMLEKVAPDLARRISEHQRIIHFRHVLVHGYDILNYDVIWNVIENKLSVLNREVETLLQELEEK